MTCHATLTFGCSTCIDRVRTDQRRAEYAEWTDDALYGEWVSNPRGEDDDIIAGLLVERSVLTIDEVQRPSARAADIRLARGVIK